MPLDKNTLARERRKQRRLEHLGSNTPRCSTCGESDWRCLERHHVADHGRDDLTVAICRNCHRKVSVDHDFHPAFDPDADPLLDRIGHFLLGLVALFRLLIAKLEEYGHALIVRAASNDGSASA